MAGPGVSRFAAPFVIGGRALPNRVVLGPMAGVTTSSFRRLLKRHGVGLVVTEMVSVHGLIAGQSAHQGLPAVHRGGAATRPPTVR